MTMKEIARLAGTSTATVSRALSDPHLVSPQTLDRVMDAVRRAGYTPNLLARNLRRMESRAVVVIVPDIANPFFPEIVRGIEEVAHRSGYCVLLGDTQGQPHRERAYASMVLERRADGLVILSGRVPEPLPEYLALRPDSVPIVMACEYVDDSDLPTVIIDNRRAAQTATEHLLALGHREIGFIAGPAGNVLTRDRLEGYRQALGAAGLAAAEQVAAGDFSIISGIRAAQDLLARSPRPTALVCSNDEMALGAIQLAKRSGLRVPHHLSVVGFDDIRFAAVSDPPLTTISQPREDIGRHAMDMLLGLLEKRPPEPRHLVLTADLTQRTSTAAPSNTSR